MKTLSFVIPVYNEEERLEKTLQALGQGFDYHGINLKEIIFVNDGSTDNTGSMLKAESKKLKTAIGAEINIISYQPNKGKGHAIRTGMLASTSDYTLFFDADMATPLTEFKKFIPYINQNKPVIIGTRKNGESTVIKHQPFYRENMGRVFTLLANIILNTWVTDFTCGFKAFSYQAKEEIFRKSQVNGWSYDAEILFLAKKLGYEITEKAVLWSDDNRTRVNLIKDSIRSFKEIIQIRLNNLEINYSPLKKLALAHQNR